MCAVKRSQHAAVKYFLARGFPLDKYTDAKWRTPLHVAVACADLQTVDLLLEVLYKSNRVQYVTVSVIKICAHFVNFRTPYIKTVNRTISVTDFIFPLERRGESIGEERPIWENSNSLRCGYL